MVHHSQNLSECVVHLQTFNHQLVSDSAFPAGHCLLLSQVLTPSRLTCPKAYTHYVRTQYGFRPDRSELDTGLMSAARNGISFFETNYSKSRQEICVDSLPS